MKLWDYLNKESDLNDWKYGLWFLAIVLSICGIVMLIGITFY